jgi:hypothetical protein
MGKIALALTTMLLSISISLRGKREHRRFRYFEKLAAVDRLELELSSWLYPSETVIELVRRLSTGDQHQDRAAS